MHLIPLDSTQLDAAIVDLDGTMVNTLGDFGTNDMLVGDVLRTNEMQVWFLSEHLVDAPITHVD